MIKTILTSVLCMMVISYGLFSKPSYSVMTGNRCQNCHFSSQGGGLRNQLGWYSYNERSLVKPEKVGLGGLFKHTQKTNTFLDETITVGLDGRYQTARLGSAHGSEREFFFMQLSPYLGISPYTWLDLYGQVNMVKTLYPGQQQWSAALIIKPNYSWPKLIVGFIQPSIGNRYDDHTTLIRQVAGLAHARPIVPPDYAEMGAEISYESLKWVSLTVGAYGAKNMSEILLEDKNGAFVPLVNSNELSKLARIAFWPRFGRNFINTNVGASCFINDDYKLYNIFFHIGWTDHIALMAEYAISDKKDLRETNNLLLEISYKLFEGLVPSIRYESANTDVIADPNETVNYSAQQYVLGASIYPLPNIELRPEYRIYDRKNFESYSSQWAVQLHIYY